MEWAGRAAPHPDPPRRPDNISCPGNLAAYIIQHPCHGFPANHLNNSATGHPNKSEHPFAVYWSNQSPIQACLTIGLIPLPLSVCLLTVLGVTGETQVRLAAHLALTPPGQWSVSCGEPAVSHAAALTAARMQPTAAGAF